MLRNDYETKVSNLVRQLKLQQQNGSDDILNSSFNNKSLNNTITTPAHGNGHASSTNNLFASARKFSDNTLTRALSNLNVNDPSNNNNAGNTTALPPFY